MYWGHCDLIIYIHVCHEQTTAVLLYRVIVHRVLWVQLFCDCYGAINTGMYCILNGLPVILVICGKDLELGFFFFGVRVRDSIINSSAKTKHQSNW